jgi:MoaA/NifB/PqqE/SkfB family radical SAM enzyme
MKISCFTMLLNRDCPRKCQQCHVATGGPVMSATNWKKALEIIKTEFDVDFLLFYGCEPLLMGQDLVDIVDFLVKKEWIYGLYSGAPEPYFTQWIDKLIDVGLNNWSSGLDGLPGIQSMDQVTEKKVSDVIAGLQYVAERGLQTHIVTTIHKLNLHYVCDIIRWCQANIPNAQNTVNFIEWSLDPAFDFASLKSEMPTIVWDGSDEEKEEVRRVMSDIYDLSREPGMMVQTSDRYLIQAPDHYTKLDKHCGGNVGLGMDCDGTLRLCGYNRGDVMRQYSVFDLPTKKKEILEIWEDEVAKCSGCHWALMDIVREGDQIYEPSSGYLADRWESK